MTAFGRLLGIGLRRRGLRLVLGLCWLVSACVRAAIAFLTSSLAGAVMLRVTLRVGGGAGWAEIIMVVVLLFSVGSGPRMVADGGLVGDGIVSE